ncbi:6717_t:CDS:10, partial [Racocetra fulgida]
AEVNKYIARQQAELYLGESDLENKAKLRIPIGYEFFPQFREEGDVLVDKTLLIKAVLESPAQVLLITRPRSMLKTFLEIEVDENGHPLTREQSLNYKFFGGGIVKGGYGGPKNLKPLKIKIEDSLANRVIREAFEDYRYLTKSVRLSSEDKQLFQNYLRPEKLSLEQIKNGLRLLSKLLYKHFNQKVFILIDEQDSIINHLLKLLQDIIQITFQNNPYLEKGILTGILRTKPDIYAKLDNLTEYNLLNPNLSEYYGFLPNELDELLNQGIIKHLVNQVALDKIREDEVVFYSLLVFTGYLNARPIDDQYYELSIPNQEIRTFYRDKLTDWSSPNHAFILGHKICDKDETLDLVAKNILKQIKKEAYEKQMKQNFPSEKIFKLALVLRGPESKDWTESQNQISTSKEKLQERAKEGQFVCCKSLNLSMLKYFFELEVDSEGRQLSPEKKKQPPTFFRRQDKKLAVDKESMEEQGQYPVILFNLKNTRGKSYQEIENKVKDRVIKLFADYLYLEDCLKPDYKLLSSAQKEKFSFVYFTQP